MKIWDYIEILAKCKKESIRNSMQMINPLHKEYAIREYHCLDALEYIAKAFNKNI